MRLIQRIFTTLTCVALLTAIGCGGSEPTGKLTGKVTLDGEPVSSGEVSMIGNNGFAATGIIESGSFTIAEPVPIGSYVFTVGPPPLTTAPGEEGGTAELPETNIPDGYSDDTMSDLKVDITEGENTVTLEMKSAGPGK